MSIFKRAKTLPAIAKELFETQGSHRYNVTNLLKRQVRGILSCLEYQIMDHGQMCFCDTTERLIPASKCFNCEAVLLMGKIIEETGVKYPVPVVGKKYREAK